MRTGGACRLVAVRAIQDARERLIVDCESVR